MKVKICGLRRMEDIEIVNKYKPDYVGFVFAKSKREVNIEEAKKLIEKLDKDIKSVGVFVDLEPEKVNEIKKISGIDIVQLHGHEDIDYCQKIDGTIWKAFRVKDESIKEDIEKYSNIAEILLLDAHVKGVAGGSGKKFDWNLVNKIGKKDNIALAGGINIENIDEARERVNPILLDVSSGVEAGGFKEEGLIREFLKKVRERKV